MPRGRRHVTQEGHIARHTGGRVPEVRGVGCYGRSTPRTVAPGATRRAWGGRPPMGGPAVRVHALHPVRSRTRAVAVVAIVATALLLAWARPAWAHHLQVSGTTSCPDENHLVTWTIHNVETLPSRPMTI